MISNEEDSRKLKFDCNLYDGIYLIYPGLASICSKRLKRLYHVTVFTRTIHQFDALSLYTFYNLKSETLKTFDGENILFVMQRMHDITGYTQNEYYLWVYATNWVTSQPIVFRLESKSLYIHGHIEIWDPGINIHLFMVIFFSGAQSLLIHY